jgi:hypothetical protein
MEWGEQRKLASEMIEQVQVRDSKTFCNKFEKLIFQRDFSSHVA